MRVPPVSVPPAVLRAALKSRARLQNLVDRGVPAEIALLDLTWGVQRTVVAGALVTSGLADALGEDARYPAELTGELGLDSDVTVRILRTALIVRLVAWDRDGRVSLSRVGAPLRADHPSSVASWVATQASQVVLGSYGQLDAQLREGAQPSGVRRATGASLWDHFGAHPAEGARFGRAMRELTAIELAALVRGYPWPSSGVICDVAGGIGTLLAAILERRTAVRGILIDDPDVLTEAEGFLQARGLAGRVDRRSGNLFAHLDACADVYIMKWILHDWNDDACRDILSRLRNTMPAGAKVVTIDQHLDPEHPDGVAAVTDLHMMAVCEGGRERGPEQVHALMRDAGLKPGKVRHAGLQMLVEGVA
jgi:O-methyltransferase domain